MARQEAGKQSPSRWRRDGVDLQALEEKLRIEIDPAFFEPEQDFRGGCDTLEVGFQRLIPSSNAVRSPFNQVIEILSVSLDQDGEDDRNPDFEQLADNPLHKNIQRQLQVCSNVVERITVEHHGSLNSSVQAMGGVARHYNQTRANVGTLREQLRECKQLLQTGVSQTDVRELWQRKLQYSFVLRLLGALDMIKGPEGALVTMAKLVNERLVSRGKMIVLFCNLGLRHNLGFEDAPVKFERLVRQKRFVAAVTLLNESLLNIFSPELVDVPAVSSVRDEMLVQKGRILDMLVEEIVDVLFLRATTTQFKSTDQSRGATKSRRRRERGGANSTVSDDYLPAATRTHGTVGIGTSGASTDAASESSAGEGDAIAMSWAGIAVDVTDVGDEDEQALDNPSQEFSVYLRLLVEAVRRLRCLDDVERYLLERLRNEVVTLSAMNMRTCVGRHEDDAAKSRGGSANGSSRSDLPSTRLQRLIPYLSLVFESFTFVLANHMHLVRLLHAARLRDLRESDPGTPVFEADAPYKESLVLSLWQHIQTHLMEVLSRHIQSQGDVDSTIEAGKFNAGKSENAVRRTTYRSGPHNSDQSLMPSKGPQVPLRRSEPSTVGIVGAALELDHASAADYSRTCMLADPSPLVLIGIFRPTLRFVEVEQGMINAMRKEVLESGHIRERPGRRVVQEAADNEGSSLSTFMHNAARDKLLPLLSADCQKTHRELVGDQDSFLPRSMAAASQASAKRNPSESSRGVSASGNPVRERKSISAGSIQPSKGAEDIYVQARTLFRAMVQMSHYSEEIGEILRRSLEDYFSMVQRMFQEITESSASRSRLERFSDKLRDLLHRDAHHLTYKTHVYGRHLRWDEDGEVNDVLSMKGSVHRNTGGNQGIDGQDSHRGIGGLAGSTAEEEADDIFESEFTMLKDLWNFDNLPFPVSKQSLLSLRKQQGVACLAFSCDWLAHKLLKMSQAIRHHGGNALAPDGQSSASIGRSVSPSRMGESDARSAPGTDSTLAPTQKLRYMARKLSQLADDSLLCLRLEVYMMVSYYMQQLPSINLEVASGQGSTTAMSLGSVEDQCVVNLNRCIREEQEALSPFEPKGNVGLICPRQLLAFVLAPLTRLLPRLFVRSLRFLKSKAVTVGGVGKLNKILNTLQQTVGDVTEVNKSPGQEDGLTPDAPKDNSQALVGTVAERFGWARQYVALISMSQGELEAFIRNNRTKFSKEEYRVQWSLIGPNRRPSHGGSSGKFDTWWASEKF